MWQTFLTEVLKLAPNAVELDALDKETYNSDFVVDYVKIYRE